MKTTNTQDIEKTASNGKGDLSPKSEKIRCKCTEDCCCPNSKFYKEQRTAELNIPPPSPRKRLSILKLPQATCPCRNQKGRTKGRKFSKSKTPCSKDQDCSCTLPINALSLRNKITDLDNALKSHGRGNKRRTKNIQQKSIQISEIYEDPETKQKSIITLTEKSHVKIEIRTFCDDTSKLEKNKKKKKRKKGSRSSSKSSKSKKKKEKEKKSKGGKIKEKKPKENKSKEKKQKKEKSKKKKNKKLFGFIKKKCPATTSEHESHRKSDVSLAYQTGSTSYKDGTPLGIKAISKTERDCEGIVNTNTIIFPENFAGNLNPSSGCHMCKGISEQLLQQTQEIDSLHKSITECLRILKSSGQTVYMMNDMLEHTDPNYLTVYPHDKYNRQSARDCKVSEYTYDPEHKVRDWITHSSSLKQNEHRDQDSRSHTHKHRNQGARNYRDHDIKGSANKGNNRIPDRFDAELENYLKICRREFQIYKSKEVKIPKEKKSKSKASKETSKKTKKSKKSKKGSIPTVEEIPGPQCDREAVDCQCGAECEQLAIQTSNLSTDQSRSKKEEKKEENKAKKAAQKEAKKEAKEAKKGKKKKSKGDVNSEDPSSTTEKSEGVDTSISTENKDKDLKEKDPKISRVVGCMRKFIKCVLCRPY